ncbi:hypothetical protein BJV78DRAFT_1268149, partial [Lactifluus subvellereus]
MTLLAIIGSLFLLSGIAVAQIHAPDCSPTWQWTSNSLGQNACIVAAYLMATCNGGSSSIAPPESGWSYIGPSGVDDGDLCKCNTVTYSLLSACDACQQETGFPALVLTQKLPPVSLTLSLPEHVCPNGLSLMSRFVAQFSSSA